MAYREEGERDVTGPTRFPNIKVRVGSSFRPIVSPLCNPQDQLLAQAQAQHHPVDNLCCDTMHRKVLEDSGFTQEAENCSSGSQLGPNPASSSEEGMVDRSCGRGLTTARQKCGYGLTFHDDRRRQPLLFLDRYHRGISHGPHSPGFRSRAMLGLTKAHPNQSDKPGALIQYDSMGAMSFAGVRRGDRSTDHHQA